MTSQRTSEPRSQGLFSFRGDWEEERLWERAVSLILRLVISKLLHKLQNQYTFNGANETGCCFSLFSPPLLAKQIVLLVEPLKTQQSIDSAINSLIGWLIGRSID